MNQTTTSTRKRRRATQQAADWAAKHVSELPASDRKKLLDGAKELLPTTTLIGPRGSQPLTPADIISGLLLELDCLLANRPAEPHVRQHIEQLRRNSEAYLTECGYRKVHTTWLPISTLTNPKED